MFITRRAGGWGRADEAGPPGSGSGGSEREGARAVDRCGRRRALGAGLGPNGLLGRLRRSWAEPSFGPGCGEYVHFFKPNTKVALNNSNE